MRRPTSRKSRILTRVFLIFAILAVFASCVPPAAPVISVTPPPPPKSPEPEPEPEPVEEPAWSPEPLHVYVMDAVDEIVTDYDSVAMGWSYGTLLSAVNTQVEMWNRDNPDKRHVVGGGS